MENHTNTKEAEMSFVFSTELYEFMEAMDYIDISLYYPIIL